MARVVAIGERLAVDEARHRATSRTIAPFVAWGLVVASGVAAAGALSVAGRRISIKAPPLHATFDPVLHWQLLGAAIVGVSAVVALPIAARRLSWSRLLVASMSGAALFGVALASVRGWHRVVDPVLSRREYLAAVPRVGDVGDFLASFSQRLGTFPVHVQGHPPVPVLVAWGLRAIGLGAPGWFAGVLVVGGALAVPCGLVVVREVAGEGWARRAMPFLVVGPAAVWMVTSADALFAGVGAAGVALVVRATGRRARRGDAQALAGGVVLGVGAFLSYGLVLVGIIPLVVAWRRRAFRAIILAALGASVVVLAFLAAGFWWLDGFAATHARYVAGIASRRPYLAFVLIDLAAFAVMLGPATAAGLARLRSRRMWTIVGAGLAAVMVALLSGMAKGEVERIWLPFAPWVLIACGALAPTSSRAEGRMTVMTPRPELARWLGGQVGVAMLIESLIRTPW